MKALQQLLLTILAVSLHAATVTDVRAVTLELGSDVAAFVGQFTPNNASTGIVLGSNYFSVIGPSRTNSDYLILELADIGLADPFAQDFLVAWSAELNAEYHSTLGLGVNFAGVIGGTPTGGNYAAIYSGGNTSNLPGRTGIAGADQKYLDSIPLDTHNVHSYQVLFDAETRSFDVAIDGVDVFTNIALSATFGDNRPGMLVIGGSASTSFIGSATYYSFLFTTDPDRISPPPAEVPEPASALLLGAGILGAIGRRRGSARTR